MTITRSAITLALSAALAACGGDVGDATSGSHSGSAPVSFAAAGLYVGYFQENATTDTGDDPQAGGLVLNVPAAAGGPVTGRMDYSLAACQTDAMPTLAGTRADVTVSGTVTGKVDAPTVDGTFTAALDTTALNFKGSYLNTAGKLAVDVAGCKKYTIAANGVVELFPVATNYPKDVFTVTVTDRTIAWKQITGTASALAYVFDRPLAESNANPFLWQVALTGAVLGVDVPSTVTLVKGKQYYAAVVLLDAKQQRTAFGSVAFTAP